MSSEHLVGTSIPPFYFRHPYKARQRFLRPVWGEQPLVMIFLPAFDHPVTREYLTHYLKTYARLRGVRLACVVRSSARTVAQATQGAEFPFPIICDAPGVLYSYLGVEQAAACGAGVLPPSASTRLQRSRATAMTALPCRFYR